MYLLLGTVPLFKEPALDSPERVPTEMLLGSLKLLSVPLTIEPALRAPARVPLMLYLLLGTVPRFKDPALERPESVPTETVLGNLVVEIVPDIFETIERVPGMLGSV